MKYVSSPGKGFQLGSISNHFIRYAYAKPLQPELNRLFGTEVGDRSHYSKNMVSDQNGQITVQYLDRKGRIIASAYAGPTPEGLVDLDGREQPVTITDTLTRGNHPAKPGNEIQLVFDVALTTDNMTLNYGLKTALFDDPCVLINDREITYEVLIEVEDDDGNLLANAIQTSGQPSGLDITLFTPASTIGFVPVGDPTNTSTTSVTAGLTIYGLVPGKSYKITRTLRLNQADMDDAMDLVEAKLNSDLEDYKVNPTSSAGCLPFNYEETETCFEGCRKQCVDALSIEIDGVVHYITSFGTDNGSSTGGGFALGQSNVGQLPTQDQYTTDSNDVDYQALLAACLGECNQLFDVPDV